MKKKNYLLIFMIVVISFICSGCNGDVTRALREDGFTYNDKDFKCSAFFPANKEDTAYEKVKFFTDAYFVNEDGKLYDINLSTPFASLENCKDAQTTFSIKAIMDDKIAKGFDNKYYSLVGDSKVPKYSEITSSDNNYSTYHILLQQDDVVKVTTVDQSNGIYYILRTDGNVYSYTIKKGDRNTAPTVTSSSIAYNQNDFGERIVDYNYAGDSTTTYVKLESGKIYRMKITNLKDCTKFADVSCQYEMQEDEALTKYQNKIIAYNGKTVITDYHKFFTISGR